MKHDLECGNCDWFETYVGFEACGRVKGGFRQFTDDDWISCPPEWCPLKLEELEEGVE
jgi:hypothetical protein